MKVLLINGSPHIHGCTFTALSEVEKELNKEGIDTELISIGTKTVVVNAGTPASVWCMTISSMSLLRRQRLQMVLSLVLLSTMLRPMVRSIHCFHAYFIPTDQSWHTNRERLSSQQEEPERLLPLTN